jgi:dienelactone hydrolase
MQRVVLALLLVAACGGDDGDGGTDPDLSVEAAGPHAVGTRRQVLMDTERSRELTLQVWYPTAAAGGTFAVEELEDEPRRGEYAALLAAAPAGCPTRMAQATRDATPAAGMWPLLGFSHCHECTRFSSMTVAERLASHGFVVIAVEHTGNTLWDQLGGGGLPLDTTTLELRAGDLAFALSRVHTAPELADITAVIDHRPEMSGVFGHSFGAVTAGLYAQRFAIGAAFALAAPMENPLLPGVDVAMLDEPLGFLVAQEDNSISELGNGLIRNNFAEAVGDAWKIEVADAGHWSVSDIVGVVEGFAAGCGDGVRQTDGQPFTYLDAATGRGIAASYVTAFFKATLQGDAGARAYLDAARPVGTVTVESR